MGPGLSVVERVLVGQMRVRVLRPVIVAATMTSAAATRMLMIQRTQSTPEVAARPSAPAR